MPLGTEVGLGPGHIVLDGVQLPPPGRGHSTPLFGRLLWPNGRPSHLLQSSCSVLAQAFIAVLFAVNSTFYSGGLQLKFYFCQ